MIWFPFKIAPKKFLGIDIGTSSIKMVELGRKGEKRVLENYGELKTLSLQKAPFRISKKDTLLLSDQEVAQAISAILRKAEIQTKEVNFSIPDFASFFTTFELPPMSQKEIPQAIRYEARNYIPIPLSEITLDWSVIEEQIPNQRQTPLRILMVAIPNEIISQYQKIANLANLKLKSLEAEVFALSRSLPKNEKIIAIIDIGARSTTCSILEKGILKISHSFNVSGNELTEILSKSLRTDYEKAEELKGSLGITLKQESEKNLREILLPLIDTTLIEIKKFFNNFRRENGKEIEKIVLAGGSALLPGLKEYFFEELQKEVEIANPFSRISYPPILEETLKEMGPKYAIACGLALKGLE